MWCYAYAFMLIHIKNTHTKWYPSYGGACVCARSVIKASAQTDKHSFRPPLITRCVIYRVHIYNARVKTNLYGRIELFSALLSRRSHNWCERPSADSQLILTRAVISVMNHSRKLVRVGGAIIYELPNWRSCRRKPACCKIPVLVRLVWQMCELEATSVITDAMLK